MISSERTDNPIMQKNSEFCFNTGSSIDWHNREFRESFEVNEFINYFFRLHAIQLIINSKSEKPDYILQNKDSNKFIGVELTSVYLSNYSVPHLHMRDGIECIPFDQEKLGQYGKRLVEAVRTKIRKAQSGYNLVYPLYLSIYVNEYIAIYMDEIYWRNLVEENKVVFDDIYPFCEIVLWPLANDMVMSIKSGSIIDIK